ncbi:MAG: DNA polymerase III subunit gamma/tau [Gammaproteobacteria bacterium]|nr:DNA polymerase III subunit gamma/tau [Gammaproteobacteria bacterium]
MSYQVLARKWRPRDFSQVVGQAHVLKALVNALDSGRLHHAYLFTGTRGVGKTSLARVFAKSLNCETGVSSKPCGVCSSCVELDEGRFVDLIEVDAASRTRVDETRELLDNVQYAPTRGRFKIYLIDEVHMFSNHSFNALLKTLEEPPPHVKFLLATTDPKRLPITILSRCLQLNLKRLSAEQIAGQLRNVADRENVPAEPRALELIAEAADGSVRDSLSLLDQAIAYTGGTLSETEVAAMLGTVGTERITGLLDSLVAGEPRRLIEFARELAEVAPDFAQVLGELLGLLRRVAVYQALGDDAATLNESPAVAGLAARITPEDCQLYYQIGLLARRDLPLAPEPQAGFEMALLRMHAFRPLPEGAAGTAPAAAPARPASQRPAPAPAPAPSAAPAAKPVATAASEAAAPEAPPAPVARVPGELDWNALVPELKCTGLTRELARHCALVSFDGRLVDLAIAPQAEHLRTERQVKALETAIRESLGPDIAVRLKVDALAGQRSPAARASAEELQRQAAAEREIDADATVQALKNEFGATVERIVPRDTTH